MIKLSVCLLLSSMGLASFTLSSASQAGVYKWVDEKGVTHYTESAPAGRSAQSIRSPFTQAPAAGGAAETKTWQEKDAEFKARQMEREQAENAAQYNQKQKQAACIEARDRLRRLEEVGSLYKLDEKGERVMLDDASRTRTIEAARKKVQAYCS